MGALRDARRLVVIGRAGAGQTTLSTVLSTRLGLPLLRHRSPRDARPLLRGL